MFDNFFEQWAAKKDPRFQTFVEGKNAYESFVQDLRVRFDEMSDEHYCRAREDPRLSVAEHSFVEAIEMSEKVEALADVAVAKYQLGLVRHARCELDEAKALMTAALKVMSSLPNRNRSADMSNCLYHLGVIALKQGLLPEAVRELRRSRQMDEANADFAGMRSCDLALAACADKGADIKEPSPPTSADAASWEVPDNVGQAATEEESQTDLDVESGPVRFERRELIWLVSHSVQANDALMAHVDSLADEFGRPVAVSRVAFGAADSEHRNLPQPEPDQHLCAAILMLEKAGLHDPDFQELAVACTRRMIAAPDFRLLVYLYDLTIDELRELSDKELFIATLFDTTQIAALPSLEQLRRTLVPYMRQVERISVAEHWIDMRLRLAVVCGNLATAILFIAALLSMLGFPAWLLQSKLDWLGLHGPKLASLVLGILAFPLQSPLIFLLLRGMRTTAMAPRDNVFLMRWIGVGALIMLGASHFQNALHGPYSWLFLGLAIGVLLDSIRRAGQGARRQLIDLEALMRRSTDPAMEDPQMTVLRGDPLNPFSCPLLPALSARVFISYTPSSAKGSRLAVALHRGLKNAGASPFLDRVSIPAGANWRRSLNRHLGECDTFLCILDGKALQREWVAAELLAAIEAHRLTGVPDIVILIDPAIQQPSKAILPVFQGVMAAASKPPIQGRPQIIQLNEQTQSSLVWSFAPGRFMPTSVFTRMVALPIMLILSLLQLIGGLGIFAGIILGFLTMLDIMAKFPLTSGLIDRGWLGPITLLTAFWLGFTARATIAWGYERKHGREMGIAIPAIATVGLAYTTFVFIPKAMPLVAGWSAVLAVAGWMLVASAMRFGIKEQKSKSN